MRNKKSIIEFIDSTDLIPEQFYPKPAKLVLPDWYKSTSSYKDNKKEMYLDERGYSSSTVKKCIPMYDAMTSGYILFSQTDIIVEGSSYNKKYKFPHPDSIKVHARWQLGNYPDIRDSDDVPKWMNPWAIKTPRGYSCMFINPMNRAKSPLKFFEGVVDTDKYTAPVNFPFFLQDNSWEGIIPAGSPLIQVIPFKRESYSHKILSRRDVKNSSIEKINFLIDAISFNGYKNNLWAKKDYS